MTLPRLTGSRYQCADCGQHFAGAHAFSRHRTGEYAPGQRLCLAAADMRAIGMAPNATGFWMSERSASPDDSTQPFAAETVL
jgi:hypothetical protein